MGADCARRYKSLSNGNPMLRFGIFKSAQYPKSNEARRLAASRVSYDLLDVGEDPTEDKIEIFEDLSRRLRTSNGIFRTTFADRFRDLDQIAMRLMLSPRMNGP